MEERPDVLATSLVKEIKTTDRLGRENYLETRVPDRAVILWSIRRWTHALQD